MFYRLPGQYYKDDAATPVYEWTSVVKTSHEILIALLKPLEISRTCTRVPRLVSHNACFLLDTTSLDNNLDWKCDGGMGSWRNNGVRRHQLATHDIELQRKYAKKNRVYALKRMYFKNTSSPDLKKYASFVEGIIFLELTHPNQMVQIKRAAMLPCIYLLDFAKVAIKRPRGKDLNAGF